MSLFYLYSTPRSYFTYFKYLYNQTLLHTKLIISKTKQLILKNCFIFNNQPTCMVHSRTYLSICKLLVHIFMSQHDGMCDVLIYSYASCHSARNLTKLEDKNLWRFAGSCIQINTLK